MLHPNDFYEKIRKLQDDNAQLQLQVLALKTQVNNLQEIASTFGELIPHTAHVAVEPPIRTAQGDIHSLQVLHYTLEGEL